MVAKVCGWEIRDKAGWNPALRASNPGKTYALCLATLRACVFVFASVTLATFINDRSRIKT